MRKRTTFNWAGAIALALCISPAVHAQDARTLARAVDAHYNHLTSLQASYSEHYTGLGLDRTETGTLLLKKPGRMRWSYNDPVGKLFILDGKFAYSYTPGDAQAQRIRAKQLDDLRSPLRFLLGHTELQKELTGLAVTTAANGLFTLSGTPAGMADHVHSISLTVTASGIIQNMRIEETDGSITDFNFTAIHENVPVSDSDFTFHAPAGVEVVDGLPPV